MGAIIKNIRSALILLLLNVLLTITARPVVLIYTRLAMYTTVPDFAMHTD